MLETAQVILAKPFESTEQSTFTSIPTQSLKSTLDQINELMNAYDTSVLDLVSANEDALKALDESLTTKLIHAIQGFEFAEASQLVTALITKLR